MEEGGGGLLSFPFILLLVAVPVPRTTAVVLLVVELPVLREEEDEARECDIDSLRLAVVDPFVDAPAVVAETIFREPPEIGVLLQGGGIGVVVGEGSRVIFRQLLLVYVSSSSS